MFSFLVFLLFCLLQGGGLYIYCIYTHKKYFIYTVNLTYIWTCFIGYSFFFFFFLFSSKNRLNIKWIVCPISSVRRIAKYTSKGYKAKGLQVVKLFAEWSERARKKKDVAAAGEKVEISGTWLYKFIIPLFSINYY